MPVLSWGHSHYWDKPSNPPTPPNFTGVAVGYIPHMAVIMNACGLGGLQGFYEGLWVRVRRSVVRA